MSPIRFHQELPAKETLLEVLNHLSARTFEELVYLFDPDNSVPSREAPRGIRVVDLLRVVGNKKGELENLWERIQKYDEGNDRGGAETADVTNPRMIKKLIGILIDPDPEMGEVGLDIARYAFTIVKDSIFSDILSQPDEKIVQSLVWNLGTVEDPSEKYPELLAFAVICHDYATGLGKMKLKDALRSWIDAVCRHTQFSLEDVRADYGKLDYSKIHRVAIEIAWPKPIVESGFPYAAPEAYVRWGIHRERVDPVTSSGDRHQVLTDILGLIRSDRPAKYVEVDHVELLLETSEMHRLWEYKSELALNEENPAWQPFPVVVRLLLSPAHKVNKACPKDKIPYLHIACGEHHGKGFLDLVQDKGVFVASGFEPEDKQPSQKVRAAIAWASIGIWTRTVCNEDNLLRDTLADHAIEDVPRLIHGRRVNSEPRSVWRSAVVLFDPDLPNFEFANSKTDSNDQKMVTAALK